MDLTFDIRNSEGNQLMVALSYYDAETLMAFSSDPQVLNQEKIT